MMLLRHISLDLNGDDFQDQQGPFGFRTRYLCNFIERRIRALRFSTQGFRGIFVEGTIAYNKECSIVPDAALCVPVQFNQAEYESLDHSRSHEFFIRMFVEGILKCTADGRFDIPDAEILRAVREFREGGYIDTWVAKTKLLRGTGLRASLKCRMDQSQFELRLEIEKKGDVLLDDVILQTLPDETCYHYKFKDITCTDGRVVVTDHFGGQLFMVDVADINRAIH